MWTASVISLHIELSRLVLLKGMTLIFRHDAINSKTKVALEEVTSHKASAVLRIITYYTAT